MVLPGLMRIATGIKASTQTHPKLSHAALLHLIFNLEICRSRHVYVPRSCSRCWSGSACRGVARQDKVRMFSKDSLHCYSTAGNMWRAPNRAEVEGEVAIEYIASRRLNRSRRYTTPHTMASLQTSKRTACDRCRSQKLRCPARELGTNACTRCIRLGAWCVTSYPRPTGRAGKSGSQTLQAPHTQPELRPKETEPGTTTITTTNSLNARSRSISGAGVDDSKGYGIPNDEALVLTRLTPDPIPTHNQDPASLAAPISTPKAQTQRL
jgi:hypothetical protein